MIRSRAEHVLLHRLWTFVSLQDQLSLSEHQHIMACDECRHAVRVCLSAETFAAVLKELKREDDRLENQA